MMNNTWSIYHCKEDDDDVPLSQVLARQPSRSLLDDTSDEDDEDLIPIAALQGDRKIGQSAAEKYKERVRGKLDSPPHRRRSYEPATITSSSKRQPFSAIRSMSLHQPRTSRQDNNNDDDTDDDLPLGVVVPLPSCTPLAPASKFPLDHHGLGFAESIQNAFEAVMHRH
ncbi:hypothetical protein DFQ28_010211 [Apophysomyces sp. BC1034]|nr:hypothetical protein DFQ30_009476 [Apophysomyces sp. BC1015]KAG0184935.1 hypothetical protein DFQ28_010211 [Apophysomyces sp. BC1034]